MIRKKHLKFLITFLALGLIMTIYVVSADKKITYVALGDSVAYGQDPYGKPGYSYADYLKNYLSKNDLLRAYTKEFTKSGLRTTDLINDIRSSKTITFNKEIQSIKKILREANLVTISIGANDFLEQISFNLDRNQLLNVEVLQQKVDEIIPQVEETIKEVKKYAKGNILVIGYYNPLPQVLKYNVKEMDQLFAYVNEKYQTICKKEEVYYIDVYEEIKAHPEYSPNPLDIHLNAAGQEEIAKKIIAYLEKNILN